MANTSHEMWKAKIMALNDRKLLEYIQDMVKIRLDHARADHNMTKPEPKKKKDGSMSYSDSYAPPPRKLKPVKLSPTKLAEAGKDKEEALY